MVHVHPAHLRARRPRLHLRPPADYQSLLDRHLHRLGRRAALAASSNRFSAWASATSSPPSIGFLTLLVAHNLSLDGDTFIVLQAVLDTQFWLATHVITINLGYAATYPPACGASSTSCCASRVPRSRRRRLAHKLLRILYGTLCFAIFFSFVGTVLGGLWADDSWGRFWGWDPKENGALMIVLWNALVLHARWGGLVKGRGLANLVVAGNIVTTWSYFGVNELRRRPARLRCIESSTAMWLLMFAASQTGD